MQTSINFTYDFYEMNLKEFLSACLKVFRYGVMFLFVKDWHLLDFFVVVDDPSITFTMTSHIQINMNIFSLIISQRI